MIQRMQIHIQGVVQGVGFRPFVYNLARKLELTGHVSNNTRGVQIEVEGDETAMENFLSALRSQPPPLAYIESIESLRNLNPLGFLNFEILESTSLEERFVRISPDVGTCAECLREIFDARNRRYRYPFTNCTNCGPRFTIVQDVPYDRKTTTMKNFDMCIDCEREYQDPANRRFHAQPNACPKCGPQISFIDSNVCKEADSALTESIRSIQNGKILAIKGIGGYHLCCDALNEKAVSSLRSRKIREDKPFALMAPDSDTIREFCFVNREEEKLLTSYRRPIVILKK
ncbi:acylphosphatase, partial [bacterium]|nr:acylphosphatase [bacterium]